MYHKYGIDILRSISSNTRRSPSTPAPTPGQPQQQQSEAAVCLFALLVWPALIGVVDPVHFLACFSAAGYGG